VTTAARIIQAARPLQPRVVDLSESELKHTTTIKEKVANRKYWKTRVCNDIRDWDWGGEENRAAREGFRPGKPVDRMWTIRYSISSRGRKNGGLVYKTVKKKRAMIAESGCVLKGNCFTLLAQGNH